MPKIKIVKDSLFPRSPMWTVAVTGDAGETITNALNEDHPNCEQNTCDITHALKTGHPYAAAWMMFGATESPALSAAIGALEFNGADMPADFRTAFDAWCKSDDSDSVECTECGARAYSDLEFGCGNCGASLVIDTDVMFDEYVKCALWSSLDDNGAPLNREYGPDDIAEATLDEMRSDCESFAESNIRDLSGMDPDFAGHDFWLTRNGHGAGFWDRGLGDRGDRLTEAAHGYGESDLYVGDDGNIHGE